MKAIFVAGVHAVGKSTSCKVISDRIGIPYYTASQVIRDERASAITDGTKLVTDIDGNQRMLIQGVSRILRGGNILLDGHFTMRRKSDGGIGKVHIDVFKELHIGGVILFIDKPEEIAKRMQLRDDVSLPVEIFHEHQEAEISHAQEVTSVLGLPFVTLQAFDNEGMLKALSTWVDKAHQGING